LSVTCQLVTDRSSRKHSGSGVTQFTDRYSPIPKRFALRLSGHVDAGTAAMVFVDGTGKLGTNTVAANGNKVAVPTPQVMLNDFLNAQKRVAELERTVARLAGMVKEQAAQIQKGECAT